MYYEFNRYNIKFLFIIIISFIAFLFTIFIKYNNNIFNLITKDANDINGIIKKLNFFSHLKEKKLYIFADFFLSKYCFDKNAYYLFEYYLNNKYPAYYIINSNSDLYKSLLLSNKTKNLILYDEKEKIETILFPYLLQTKIIVLSYILPDVHRIISGVWYIKYLRINHGVRYFKITRADFYQLIPNKRNTIISSPLEYELVTSNYANKKIYKAGLPRWDRFNYIKKNESKRKCILASFSRREYRNDVFKKSLYKRNLEKLFMNNNFTRYLSNKNIDLVYIPHHRELYLKKNYSEKIFGEAKLFKPNKLEHYIEQCSLFITDFSSICFDFFFQNKPVLFYFIDINDTLNFSEKQIYKKQNDSLYFGNAFFDEDELILKVKHYVDIEFQIDNEIKKKFNSLFYYKKDIIKRISYFIEKIISE